MANKMVRFFLNDSSGKPPILYGEVNTWDRGIVLQPENGGWSTEMELPCGVYQYKYYRDGVWFTDPSNSNTVLNNGNLNSLAVVDGITGTIVHAPGLPFVWRTHNGMLVIRALLRSDNECNFFVRWSDSGGRNGGISPMRPVSRNDDYYRFEAILPTSGLTVSYFFETVRNGVSELHGSAEGILVPFRIPAFPEAPAPPSWWDNAIIYEIVVDRFRKTTAKPAPRNLLLERYGGDLNGIASSIDHFLRIGVTVLYLTPVHLSPSVHRYDAVDFTRIDPSLGGERAFTDLIEALHKHGIRLIIDLSFNHVSIDHPGFQDVVEKGECSPFSSWFKIFKYPVVIGDCGSYACYNNDPSLPLLNTGDPEVQQCAIDIVKRYVDLGVDGFRVDAAAELPDEFLGSIVRAARNKPRKTIILGEIISSGSFRYLQWFDAITDFTFYNHLSDWVCGKVADWKVLMEAILDHDFFRGAPPSACLNFLSNHDTDRITTCSKDHRVLFLLYVMLFTLPGHPMLYYGEEAGLFSDSNPTGMFEKSLHDRIPMIWDESRWNNALLKHIIRLIRIRKENGVLRKGFIRKLLVNKTDLAYRVRFLHDMIDVFLNLGTEPFQYKLEYGRFKKPQVLVSTGKSSLAEGSLSVEGMSAVIVRYIFDRRRIDAVKGRTLRLVRESYQNGRVRSGVPGVLYLSLTEKCNCSCRHCISQSGLKTQQGRFMEALPWLIDALTPYLCHFDYVGFSHGGENLLNPLFEQFVERYITERGSSRGVIHVLSNGMHSLSLFERVVKKGVNSFSISLDGISPSSNEKLRKGADTKHILSVLSLLSRIKKEYPIRFGVSTTLTKWNMEELPDMVEVLCEHGVDWFKIEELFPVNALGCALAVSARDPHIPELLNRITKICRTHSVVFCDHLDSDQWPLPCLNPRAVESPWSSDSYVNGFEIHPCTLAWQVICVEANGDVRPVSYSNPVAGNIAYTCLYDMLENHPFRDLQERSIHRCTAQGNRETCDIMRPLKVPA